MGWYGPDLQVDISKWGKVSINNAIVDADVAMDTVGPQRHLADPTFISFRGPRG
jgi:hypothetical protein